VAIDRFGDRDLQEICDQWFPLDEHWQRHLEAWPGAPLIGTGGFPWHTAHLCRDRLVAFPHTDTFQSLREPEQLRRAAENCGIAFPQTISNFQHQTESVAKAMPVPAGRWLLKPRYGTGGIGIRDASVGLLESATAPAADPSDLQQWTAGRPLGACFFSRLRCGQRHTRFLGAFDGLTHRHHREWRWLYGGSLGPRPLPPECRQVLVQLGAELASRFGLVGLFNVDLLRRRDGSLVLLEINPRYSASMELLRFPASRHDPGRWASLIDWHLAAYQEHAGEIDCDTADERTSWLSQAIDPASSISYSTAGYDADCIQPMASESACKRVVYAAAPLQIDCSAASLSRRFDCLAQVMPGVRISFHDLPPRGDTVPAGAPALSVIVRGPQSLVTLRRLAQRIAAELRRDLRAP